MRFSGAGASEKVQSLLVAVLLGCCLNAVLGYHGATNLCATFSAASAGGATGYFAMQISESTGQAFYNFALDLTKFPLSTQCPTAGTSSSLKYHIHSFWLNSGSSAYTSAKCGGSGTGGHYDPYFACSGSSCFAKAPTATMCKHIYRASDFGYKYNCNATRFGSSSGSTGGDVNLCEVGDLSGKFGLAGVKNNLVSSNGVYTDPLPPAMADFQRGGVGTTAGQTNFTTPFASIVFHCNDAPTNTPILCASLSTDISPCQSAGATFGAAPVSTSSSGSSSGKTYSQTAFDGAVAGAAIVCLLGGLLLGILSQRWAINKVADGTDRIPDKSVNNPLGG